MDSITEKTTGNYFTIFHKNEWQFTDNKEKKFVVNHDRLYLEKTWHLKIWEGE